MVTLQQSIGAPKRITASAYSPILFTVNTLPQAATSSQVDAADVYDSRVKTSTATGAFSHFTLDVGALGTCDITSLDPATAYTVGNTVLRNGSAGGPSRIRISRGSASIIVTLDTSGTSSVFTTFDTYGSGTLSKLLSDNILSRITAGKDENYFTNYSNGGPASFTKNSNCWAADIDLSGCAVDTTILGGYTSANKGALVTDQHLVGAKHWNNGLGFSIGDKFRFRSPTGAMHIRTAVGVARDFIDVVIATLDYPVPSDIKSFKVAGDWIIRNRITANYSGGLYFFADQAWRCRLLLGSTTSVVPDAGGTAPNVTINGVTFSSVRYGMSFVNQYATAPLSLFSGQQRSLHQQGVTGDSGSGIFIHNGTEAGLVGNFYSGSYCPHIGEANGGIANQIIAMADANAVALGNLVAPTGKTVVVMPQPS